MIFKIKNSKKAFTLLEILLVVGIIAILAGIVIVAINPSKQIATVRNTQRQSDIKQINSALQQYFIDHGSYPPSILDATTLTEICDTDDAPAPSGVTCTNLVDLSVLVPTYLAAIPKDPNATTTNYAGYKVIKGPTTGLISLGAPLAELGQSIVLGKEAGGSS
jgi:prepilin-type N-terminal cleavage/methylation domain-containing protein